MACEVKRESEKKARLDEKLFIMLELTEM